MRIAAVVPCHDDGEYVLEAASSLREQVDCDVEVIVVDDASSDPLTRQVLLDMERHESGVRILRLKRQFGPGGARNAGIKVAETSFVLVLDADDRLEPGFASACLERLESDPDTAVSSSWITTFGAADWQLRPRGGGAVEFVQRNECGSMALLRRSDWLAVGGFSNDVIFEDYDFYLKLTTAGKRIDIVETFLAWYRLRDSSRNVLAAKDRPAAMAQLFARHEQLFQRYALVALQSREELIADLRGSTADGRLPLLQYGDGSTPHLLSVLDTDSSTK